MKQLLIAFSVLFLFSCRGNSEEKSTEDFSTITFSMDTVIIDSGDDIFNLRYGLFVSDISKDAKFLYNWNQETTELERVNLDELVLEEKIKFEKEGPNGVGSYVSWISLKGKDQVLFANFEGLGLFDFRGEKLQSFKLNGEIFQGDSLGEFESFTRQAIISEEGNTVYGILGNWTGKDFYLGIVDFQNKTLKKKALPGFEKLIDYSVTLKGNEMFMISAPGQYINKEGDRIILSNSAFNTLLVYDLALDSMYQVDYTSRLTKSGKTGKYVTEVENEKDFNNAMNEINLEINFIDPVWDNSRQRFYRFSYETLPKEDRLDEEEKTKSKVYLTIFDKDFHVLGESEVEELDYIPAFHFVKDGKIWVFKNLDDELGFVRIGID